MQGSPKNRDIYDSVEYLTPWIHDFLKDNKFFRLTDLTDKKLRLQIAGMVICEYAVTYLAHATFSYCKRLPQKKIE